MDDSGTWGREWTTLQNNYERYEFGALLVKLAAIVLFFAAMALALEPEFVGLLMAVLWLQEGIFKTYQSRLGERLLHIEQVLAAGGAPAGPPFQLHTDWMARRSGAAGLLAQYLGSAMRPTVAFPYAVLLVLAWLWPGS